MISRIPEDRKTEFSKLYSKIDELYEEGLYGMAIDSATDLCNTIRKSRGNRDPEYASCLNKLSWIYGNIGDLSSAISISRRSLSIRERLNKNNIDYANSLNNLAMLYVATTKYAMAESLLLRSLAVKKKRLGSRHPDYAVSLNKIAMLYQQIGNAVKAEEYYRKFLTAKRNTLAFNPQYENDLNNLNEVYLKRKKEFDFINQIIKKENLIKT